MLELLLPILACPECRNSSLIIASTVLNDYPVQLRSIINRELVCASCERRYPLSEDDIPFLWSDTLRDTYLITLESDNWLNEDNEERVKAANIQLYDQIAKDYDDVMHTDDTFFSRIRNAIELIDSYDSRVHLDIGCGPGNVLDAWQSRSGVQIGLDISLSNLRIVKTKGYHAVLGDAEKLPFRSNCASIISASSVLHHLYKPQNLISETYRVLSAYGGLVTDYDPNARALNLGVLASFLFRLRKPVYRILSIIDRQYFFHGNPRIQHLTEIAEHLNRPGKGFQPDELRRMLTDNGFEVLLLLLHNGNSSSLDASANWSPSIRNAILQALSLGNPFNVQNASTILTVSRKHALASPEDSSLPPDWN